MHTCTHKKLDILNSSNVFSIRKVIESDVYKLKTIQHFGSSETTEEYVCDGLVNTITDNPFKDNEECFEIRESCDDYFALILTPAEMRSLISELNELVS